MLMALVVLSNKKFSELSKLIKLLFAGFDMCAFFHKIY
ncbi:hypothetical protein B4168_2769 [Anoxybacillus flavithermus]|nr:hypothetical protein B4168_2769 [Anoxybacillus flavithermus]OAO87536.1 hypothetical protein GT23_1185 [Parageobacillus thermoglucosidasius]